MFFIHVMNKTLCKKVIIDIIYYIKEYLTARYLRNFISSIKKKIFIK